MKNGYLVTVGSKLSVRTLAAMLPDALALLPMRNVGWSFSARGRNSLLLAVLIAGVASTASAQLVSLSSAQSPTQSSQTTRVLSGTVVNAITNEAIPFALVQAGQEVALADQNGQFHFEMPVSTFAVEAHKPGFFNDRELTEGSGPPMMITLADKSLSVNVRLTPEAVITGNVHTPDGAGIERLPVRLRFRRVINGRGSWQTKPGHATDEDGNFRIAGLTPGTYFVEVGPSFSGRPATVAAATSKIEGISKQYYPGVSEMSAATSLRLGAGQHSSIEVTVKPSPAYRLGGIVAGAFPANGGLLLTDPDGENVGVGVRFEAATGRFEAFPVPAGSYRLKLSGQDASGNALFADVPINLSSDLMNVRITAQRSVNIPVVVQNDMNGKETSGSSSGSGSVVAMVRAGSMPQIMNVHLVSRSDFEHYWPMRDGSDGRFIFRGVKPGIYDVEVQPMGTGYVASLTSSGIDLLRDPLVIAEGSDPQPIEALVRNDSATLDGSVRLDAAQQVATILVFSEKNLLSSLHAFAANPSGDFHLQGLAPGDYDVLAFDRVDGIEYQNREALSSYLSHAAHVTLAAEQQSKVTVDLIHTRE
jgi:hypothetical protein